MKKKYNQIEAEKAMKRYRKLLAEKTRLRMGVVEMAENHNVTHQRMSYMLARAKAEK